jgi:hypothetical protein
LIQKLTTFPSDIGTRSVPSRQDLSRLCAK